MHSGTLSVLCLLALAVAVAPVVANYLPEKCYFIQVHDYYSPYYTYHAYKDVPTGYDCAKYCANDYECLAYTFEKDTHRCALKNDSKGCMELLHAETGIKYIGKYKPVLKDNDLKAVVIYVKDLPYEDIYGYQHGDKYGDAYGHGYGGDYVAHKPHGGSVVSASAVAVSNGGLSVAESYADNYGIKTKNYVFGNGYSYSNAKNPYISLTVGLKKTGVYYPGYAIEYYKETKPIAVCKTIYGKEVYFYAPKKEEPKYNYGYDTPCHLQTDTGYYGYTGTDLISTYKTIEKPVACCDICRKTASCLAWNYEKYSKDCYLMKHVVKAKAHAGFYSGTCL